MVNQLGKNNLSDGITFILFDSDLHNKTLLIVLDYFIIIIFGDKVVVKMSPKSDRA